MNVHCFNDKEKCTNELGQRIANIAAHSIREKGRFSLVLTGGSTPVSLYRMLASKEWSNRIDWQKCTVFFGDERCVPPENNESNYKMAWKSFLHKVDLNDDNVHRIHGEKAPEDEAARYEQLIRESVGVDHSAGEPFFDIMLLGMGEDGHCASLFPGSRELASTNLVTACDAPEHMSPKVRRISLTLSGIARAEKVFFLVDGLNKQKKLLAVLEDKHGLYPASMLKNDGVEWYISNMDCTMFSQYVLGAES